MGTLVRVYPEFRSRVPAGFAPWAEARGEEVARSRTTLTVRTTLGDVPVHLKRYHYPLGVALGAALRNTFLGRSRADREFRALTALRQRAPDLAPAPVAFGERRTLGLLREAFVATETVPGAVPLTPAHLADRAAAHALGQFLRRLRTVGLLHGSLFARNLIVGGDGRLRVVDLDRAVLYPLIGHGRPQQEFLSRWPRELACLDASLAGWRRTQRLRAFLTFLGERGDRATRARRIADVLAHRPAAEARLAHRLPA